MEFARVVLKPEATYSDVLMTGTQTKQWKASFSTPLRPDEPYGKGWKSVDGRCVIRYVQDPVRELRLYHLTGADLATHAAVVRGRMPTYETAEIGARIAAAQTPAEKVEAVCLAAASATPAPDPSALAFLTRSLEDPDPAVRRTAVDAALVAPWPDLRGPLERVAAADTDPDLRAFAGETLETLRGKAWECPTGAYDFAPLPPDRRRVAPRTGIGDNWYEAAHGRRPERAVPPPAAGARPALDPPDWLAALVRAGDWGGVRWHSPEEIKAAAAVPATTALLLPKEADSRRSDEELLARMVTVGAGPEMEDRTGRALKARLFVDRESPGRLLVALAENHPPSLWVPAGTTRESVDAVLGAYYFPGLPAQKTLPFGGRLFLTTTTMLGGDFQTIENRLAQSAFCDALIWGSSHPTDPYPEKVALGRIPVAELRRYLAQAAGVRPRTSVRTRFSRSVIQAVDFDDGYFADLYFRPAPPEFAAEFNRRHGTEFPPGTPADVVAALGGFTLVGPGPVRAQMEEAEDEYQRTGMQAIIDFLERGPAD